jgi:hypothetical protein
VLAAHDDDRARRVPRTVPADGSEQRLSEPAVTPAAHYEQIGPRGRLHQHLSRASLHHARADLDIGVDGARLGERLAQDGARVVLEIGHVGGRKPAGAHRDMPRRHGLHHGPGEPCLVDGPPQRVLG